MHVSLKSWSWWRLLHSKTSFPHLSCFESLIQSSESYCFSFCGLPESLYNEKRLLLFPLHSAQSHVEGECKPAVYSAYAMEDQLLGACPSRNQQSWEPAIPTSAPSLWKEVNPSSTCCSRVGCLELYVQQKSPFPVTPTEDLHLACSFINYFPPDFPALQLLSDTTASVFSKWTFLKHTWEYFTGDFKG